MAMLSIRGIDEQTSSLLKQEAKRRGISINTLILELLRRGIGLSPEKSIYHDLDHLAGTWTAEEAAAFLETQQDFERIEEDLCKRTPVGASLLAKVATRHLEERACSRMW